jgi:hypothetical protein
MTGATSGLINGGTAVLTDTGATTSVFGRTGDVIAQTGDYAAFYVPYTGANAGVDLNTQTLKSGVFFPLQAATVSAPAYVKGGMYFDTTLNKLRIGGATAWETVTSI